MVYHIITTQPSIFNSFLKTGLVARGIDKKIIDIDIINLYDFGIGSHKSIDDTPYGGGAGMVIRVDIIDKVISTLKRKSKNEKVKIILLTPHGQKFTQKMAKKLAKWAQGPSASGGVKGLILIAGRFEGYDERIRQLADEEISIGDYVLSNGDLPAMVLIDAISRHIPGFIQKSESIENESFNPITLEAKRFALLEYPQYTRPLEYKGKKVPPVLLSGNHAQITKWRKKEAIKRTQKRRPDLIDKSC